MAMAVAILHMYQMQSGGHLFQPPALSRDNSTFRPGCSGLFSARGQIPDCSGKAVLVLYYLPNENRK